MDQVLWTPVAFAAFLGVALICFLWLKSRKVHDTWKRLGVPFIPPMAILDSLHQNREKTFHGIEEERYKTYGRLYGYYEGDTPVLSVGDPEILRNILVKDFYTFSDKRGVSSQDPVIKNMLQALQGEHWKRVRTAISPAFTTAKIKRIMSIFSNCSKVLVENFKTSADMSEPIDVKSVYGAFAMDVIASAAFSTKIDSHNDPHNVFVLKAKSVFKRPHDWRYNLYRHFPRLAQLFRARTFLSEGSEFFSEVTRQIIEERKKTGKKEDFLQLLLDAAHEEFDKRKDNVRDDLTKNYEDGTSDEFLKDYKPSKKTLSLIEVVSQCVIFFLAGYQTTASLLSFATYFLALHPEIQDKLREEVDGAISECNGEVTYEVLQNMKYLDNVISETLRINPSVIRIERKSTKAYRLESAGIVIPKGTVVSVPVYAIHRDPEFFSQPEKFDPDRFGSKERIPYTYLPFGAGPRNCLGMRFALIEVKVCLAHVVANFTLHKCSKTQVPLEYSPGQCILQAKEIVIDMRVRPSCLLR